MRRLLLAALFAVIQLAADTYPRQPGIDALHYVFRVTLSDDTDEIIGEATANFDSSRMESRISRSISHQPPAARACL
jgi:hypothetical protein